MRFQRHLAIRGIAVAAEQEISTSKGGGTLHQNKLWLVLRDSARFVGDSFARVVSEDEITVLQKVDRDVGR